MKATSIIVLAMSLGACKVTQRQEANGEITAKVIIEFPQAQMCFQDPRITTYEQLKECLELVTNNKWTVDVAGEVVEALETAVDADETESNSEVPPEEGADEAVNVPSNIQGAA